MIIFAFGLTDEPGIGDDIEFWLGLLVIPGVIAIAATLLIYKIIRKLTFSRGGALKRSKNLSVQLSFFIMLLLTIILGPIF